MAMKLQENGVEWRPIAGWPNYEVSNTGLVRSSWRGLHILKGKPSGKGYRAINTTVAPYKRGTLLFHRAVAEAFIPNPRNLPQVNHKDGNKLNNHVNNLEWVTDSDNKFHAHRLGLISYTGSPGENNPSAKLTQPIVEDIRRTYAEGGITQKALAAQYGVQQCTISSIILRKTWA